VTSGPVAGLHWQKLHPLTPVIQAARSAVFIVIVIGEERARGNQVGGNTGFFIALGILVLALVFSFVRWTVTRWALDGTTLRIETGLFRRDARQLPLARIQAVDVVRPLLARIAGLAELRVRLAGSSRSGGRLGFLPEAVAVDLRARLLAGQHGLDLATPEPAEQAIASVATGQLVASALLSPATPIALALVVAILVLLTVAPAAAAASAGTLLVYALSFGQITWRRVAEQYGFAVGLAPDGIRVKRGLLSTVSETIPFTRVQAVRRVEPLLWRTLGWCRLEVDVAGSPGREQGRSGVTKSLLPVGKRSVADGLFTTLLGLRQFELERPPRRARWKSPISYHFLASGCDGNVLAATTGRLNRTTTWVPLEKVQSIRRVQGPLQRALRLATVHADAAGRRVQADLRDRDVAQADQWFDQLVVQSRAARQRATTLAAPTKLGAAHPLGAASIVSPGAANGGLGPTGQPVPPPPAGLPGSALTGSVQTGSAPPGSVPQSSVP